MDSAIIQTVDHSSDPQSLEIASLELLRKIANELCPDSGAKGQTPIPLYKQVISEPSAPQRYDSMPLLCDERGADEFIRGSKQKTLAVIGVDAAMVRNRLAALLIRLLFRSKDMVEHETVSHLEEVTERVTSFDEEAENLFWVVEYVGTNNLPVLGQDFMHKLVASLTDKKQRLKTILLVPIFYAAEIAKATKTSFFAESLTFEKVFVPERLRIWLCEVFPELIDSEEEQSLAQEMCRIVHEPETVWASNVNLDVILLALNRWWRTVIARNQPRNDLDALLDTWRESLTSVAKRGTRGQDPDDDLRVRRRFSTDDLDDWDLRISSRAPSEKARK